MCWWSQSALMQVMACFLFGKPLPHWGRVTHICISKLTIVGSDNGLLPGWRQTIIWTNAGMLLIGPLGTSFSETLIEIYIFSFKKMHLQLSSRKWRPLCLVLTEPMPTFSQVDAQNQISVNFYGNSNFFSQERCISKCCLQNGSHFVQAPMY